LGFTLVELLVVVSIIALLISILLPSLKGARDSAKRVACGATLAGFGKGILTYTSENNDWIPGINTSGFETWRLAYGSTPAVIEALKKPNTPVQTFDWLTPIIRVQTKLPTGRPQRYRVVGSDYRCPSVKEKCIYWQTVSPKPVDFSQFQEETTARGPLYSSSYLMPTHFQLWGQSSLTTKLGKPLILPFDITAKVADPSWEVVVNSYTSRINRVGPPAEKIAASDATRFLDKDGLLTINPEIAPSVFGAFTTAGGWWRGSTEFGDTKGWAGSSAGVPNQLPLTFRHRNGIEATFFDGHVEALSRKQSTKIDYWYPKGGVVKKTEQGYSTLPGGGDGYATYQNGYVIR
jgi:prepilin-type N-terminal cleavage/methylation domain-containing protein/prepilin-type processing-associated H-X9-DG protein